jgi:hypothetical protein
MRTAALVTLAAVVLAFPSAVLAQGPGNPLSPGLPAQPQTTPTATAPTLPNVTTSTSPNGLGGSNAVVIALGAIAVLAGISFFIWRDARRRAPVRRAAAATAGGERQSAKQRGKPRKLSPAERRRRKRGRAR